ncbi:conserved protein of unknown function [Pseudomonas marincola]|uniref:Uncharacterized protein n=1 Tax=Pseudomonas marincola TaxID=437900 RepID=A0A653E662_9PSED|nr:hypothetical protein [Pseudomonas marincola]CAE6906123.1 conserved protein of unknown function [Pseudomonas marincola]
MSEYTESIKKAADALDLAEQAFALATNRLATVRCHNGQSGYSVTVNGVTVAVSQCDSRTYQGTLIRGREMIHLGALKALGAEVQTAADRVRDCRAYLASIVVA